MSDRKKVAFYTLGCKLNFSETSTIARNFNDEGFDRVDFEEVADIYVINTCSVTENADKQFKQVVKKAMKLNDKAFVAAVGCYAQLKPEELAAVDGVDLVLGATEKFKITDYINDLLDAQEKGELDYSLCIMWDSVGSVPCKMTYEGKGGKQHNASVLADKIGMGINQRISGSRKADSKYENTLIIVNQPWVELPDNPFGQPKIKAKGGEAIWLNSSLVFLFGNQKGAGTTKITATKDKRTVKFASRTKVSVMKNHINGLGFEDGRIIVTPHGFLPGKDTTEEKASIEKYKKEYADYWKDVIGVDGDFDLKTEKEEVE